MDNIAWICLSAAFFPALFFLSIKNPFILFFGSYVFLLPFDNILSVSGNAQGATVTKFLGILTILVLPLKAAYSNRLKKPAFASFWWIAMISLGVASISWAIAPETAIDRIPTATGLLVLYLVVAVYKVHENEIHTIKLLIVAGGFVGALYLIHVYASGGSFGYYSRATMFIGERTTDPNKFAFSLLIPIAVCTELILKKNRKLIKSLFITVLAVLIFSLLITASRSGALGMVTLFIVYILLTKRKITIGTIAIIVGIIIVPLIPSFVIERISKAAETGGGIRPSIWYVGLKSLEQFWLLGSGLSNFPNAYDEFSHYALTYAKPGRDAHNSYMAIVVELGIVGFSCMIMAMISHYRLISSEMFHRYNNTRVMLKAALAGMLVSSFFLTTIWMKSFWLIWVMIVMERNCVNKSKVSIKDEGEPAVINNRELSPEPIS